MRARKAIDRDISNVFSRLAQRMAEEYDAAGYSLAQVKKLFRSLLRAGNGDSLVDSNGDVVGVIVWFVEDGLLHTSFAAKESFFSVPWTKFSRRHLRAIQAAHGNLPVVSTSYSTRDDVSKWFQVLGYRIGERLEKAQRFVLPGRS